MGKYLIDINLPRYFSVWATDEFEFVHDIDVRWKDTQIWQYATTNNLTIVTKDTDFSDRVLVSAIGPHVIHLRIGNMRMRAFHTLISGLWEDVCRLSIDHRLVHVYQDRIEAIE